MATKILLSRSGVTGHTPNVAQLEFGELVLNYKDGKLFFKRLEGLTETIVSLEFSLSGKVATALNLNGTILELLDRDDNVIDFVDLSSLGGGIGANFHTHIQSAPNAIWTITHNLNRYPSVTIVDNSGSLVEGCITYINSNNIEVAFKNGQGAFPLTGTAHLI